MYYIFLESLDKIQTNRDDSRHHDCHQEGQDDQEHSLRTGRFFVYPIFLETLDKMQFNGNDPSHHEHHQEGQDDEKHPPSTCILYFWKP